MIEVTLVVVAGGAGFALAWYLGGVRAQATLAHVEARLTAVGQQYTERSHELDTSKSAQPPGEEGRSDGD